MTLLIYPLSRIEGHAQVVIEEHEGQVISAHFQGAASLRALVRIFARNMPSRLLETPFGSVEWSCDAPGAGVEIVCEDGVTIRGAGYSEHMVLAMLPWKLPIDELRWGRWLSPSSTGPRSRRPIATSPGSRASPG